MRDNVYGKRVGFNIAYFYMIGFLAPALVAGYALLPIIIPWIVSLSFDRSMFPSRADLIGYMIYILLMAVVAIVIYRLSTPTDAPKRKTLGAKSPEDSPAK